MGHLWGLSGYLGGLESHLGGLEGHLGRFLRDHWLAGGHLVDLGGHLVATRAAKSLDIDFPMDVARLFVGGYPVQVISEGFLGGLGGSCFGA